MRRRRSFSFLWIAMVLIGLGGSAIITPAQEKPKSSSSVEETRPNEDVMLKAIGQNMVGEPDGSLQGTNETPSSLPSMRSLLVRLIGALMITLVVLYAVLRGLKRFMGHRGIISTLHIQVIGKTYLSPKTVVYLVEIAGQVLVVGENPNGLALLTTIADKETLIANTAGLDEREGVSLKPSPQTGLMADFMNQLGRFRSQQSAEHLSKKLRESTQVANSLKHRIGEPQASETWEDVVPRK